MTHDLPAFLTHAAVAAPSTQTSPLILALIGAAGLVVAAVLPVLLTRWIARRKNTPEGMTEIDLEAHYNALRIWLSGRGIDARKIKTGYEADADVYH